MKLNFISCIEISVIHIYDFTCYYVKTFHEINALTSQEERMSEGRARSVASLASQSSLYTVESTVLNQDTELFAPEGLPVPYPTKVSHLFLH